MLIVVVDPNLNIKMRLILVQLMFSRFSWPALSQEKPHLLDVSLGDCCCLWLGPNNSLEVGAGKGCGVSGAQNVS